MHPIQVLHLFEQNLHNPSASQVSQTNLSNSLAFPYPPDPGEHVLKGVLQQQVSRISQWNGSSSSTQVLSQG